MYIYIYIYIYPTSSWGRHVCLLGFVFLFGFNATLANCVRNADAATASAAAYALTLTALLLLMFLLLLLLFLFLLLLWQWAVFVFVFVAAPFVVRMPLRLLFRVPAKRKARHVAAPRPPHTLAKERTQQHQ